MNNALDTPESAGIFSRLNEEQIQAVSASGNTVVAAGAGSGKTTVLACRFAHLVINLGIPADRILTLTFTKKAAAEMYGRIYSTLKRTAEYGSGIPRERAREAVTHFFQTHIQTLDSYSAAVVRLAAHRYGIRPDFTMDDGSGSGQASQMALQFLLEHRTHPVIQAYLQSGSPEMLADVLFARPVTCFSLVSRPAGFRNSVPALFDRISRDWQNATTCAATLIEAAVRSVLEEQPSATSKGGKRLYDFVKDAQNGKFDLPETGYLSGYFASLLTRKPGTASRYPLPAAAVKDIVHLADVILEIPKKDGRLRTIPETNHILEELDLCKIRIRSLAAQILVAGTTADLLYLLEQFETKFLDWKRNSGCLGFADIATLAVTILSEQQDIRQNEKSSFDAIMIDEFQDNNRLQRDLLYLLAEQQTIHKHGIPTEEDLCPGKLFFVGDEKQSIYRFRGADVSVFRNLKNELCGGIAMPLSCNYRSNPALIHAFNLLFSGGILPVAGENPPAGLRASVFLHPENPKDMPVYEAFGDKTVIPPAADRTQEQINVYRQTPAVHIHLLDTEQTAADEAEEILEQTIDTESLVPAEQEAVHAAKIITELIQAGSYEYKDIAILLRTTTKQRFYEKYLREAGIPYVTENIVGFFFDGPVNDILHMLRITAYPADILSYTAVLSSPFAGLTLTGCADCISLYTARLDSPDQTGTENSPRPFDEAAETVLSSPDAAAYRKGRKIYRTLCDRSSGSRITDLISYLWYEAGYRYETIWNKDVVLYRELYDYLYELARQADENGKTIAAFTDDLYRMKDAGEKLENMEIPLDRPPAVTIMTIHKSKGLEFPVVLLCDTDSRTSSNRQTDFISRQEDGTISVRIPLPEQLAAGGNTDDRWYTRIEPETEKNKATAELRRLFYVAATRAEKELYLLGKIPLKITDENPLPLALTGYVATKQENQEEFVPGTTIPNTLLLDDTMTGLYLPVIAGWLDSPDQPPLFTLHKIPAYTRSDSGNSDRFPVTVTKVSIQEQASRLYTGIPVTVTPKLSLNRLTPSSLEETVPVPAAPLPAGTENIPMIQLRELDALLDYFRQTALPGQNPVFGAADFGTIVHAYVAAHLSGSRPVIPAVFAARLTNAQYDTVDTAARHLTGVFLESDMGKAVKSAEWYKNEYGFTSCISAGKGCKYFIDGQIDLLFEQNGTIFIVDFKTDVQIRPERYIPQLACYRNAAEQIFRNPSCKCYLYYLRFGTTVDITSQTRLYRFPE